MRTPSTTPPKTAEELELPVTTDTAKRPTDDDDRIVFSSWDAPLVPSR